MQFDNAAFTCEFLDMSDQAPAQALALGVRVDGDVHQMGGCAVERQDRATHKLTVEFGHEDVMVTNVICEASGDVRQIR